jgi:hypothetical protein
MRIRCCGNLFTEQLPSDSPGIVDVFSDCYQAIHVPSRDRCLATAIQATLFLSESMLNTTELKMNIVKNT